MTKLPSNPIRGLTGLAALVCMTIGAGMLWGFGGALLTLGLFLAIDCSFDEAVERATKTTRWQSFEDVGSPKP